MWQWLTLTGELAVIAAIVYVLLKGLRVKPVVPTIANPRRNSMIAVAVLAATLACALAGVLIWQTATGRSFVATRPGKHFQLSDLLATVATIPIYLLPIAVVIKRREPLESLGLTTRNLWQSVVVGILLACLFALAGPNRLHKILNANASQVIALGVFLIVGCGEELAFRGFLQYRIVAWVGKWKGVLLTSVIMSLFHVPQMFLGDWETRNVLGRFLGYIPINLFLGVVMLNTGNLAAVALIHACADWVNVFR